MFDSISSDIIADSIVRLALACGRNSQPVIRKLWPKWWPGIRRNLAQLAVLAYLYTGLILATLDSALNPTPFAVELAAGVMGLLTLLGIVCLSGWGGYRVIRRYC